MVKKLTVTMIFVIIFNFSLFTSLNAQDYGPFKAMTPILDQNIDSSLHLSQCFGDETPFNWEEFKHRPLVSEKAVKKIKSKNYKWIEENWHGDSGGLSIKRWYFSCPEDAVIFPSTGMATTENDPFRGWDKTKDVGDNTYWNYYDYLIFTKGNVTVKVTLNSRFLSQEQQKSYIQRIAQSIINKL